MTSWAIALLTVGEARRKKVVQIFLLVALIMIVLSEAFAFFADPGGVSAGKVQEVTVGNAGRVELIVIKSMAFGVIVLAGMVMSIFLGTDLIPTEIDRKTIYTILSKPVRRSAYLLGKQLGLALTLLLNFSLMALAFLALLFFKTYHFSWEILAGVFLIFIQFFMLGSISLFFSVFLSRNINAALTFFMFVVGMLSDFLMEIMKRSAESGSHAVAWLLEILRWIIPNFAGFNALNPLIHPDQLSATNFFQYAFLKAIPYGLVYSLVLIGIACFIFEQREL
jgi:ABC-type transport system involved in multi-copper enzyme maturation permease subunit